MPYNQQATPNGGSVVMQTKTGPGNADGTAPNLASVADLDPNAIVETFAAGATSGAAVTVTATDMVVVSGGHARLQAVQNRRPRVLDCTGAALKILPATSAGKIEALAAGMISGEWGRLPTQAPSLATVPKQTCSFRNPTSQAASVFGTSACTVTGHSF